MIEIREDLCVGCGLCVKNCPNQAIYLVNRKAKIIQQKCQQCGVCLNVCPKQAIAETIAASTKEIKEIIDGLTSKTDALISRIEQLKRLR
jgi:ferredoxin